MKISKNIKWNTLKNKVQPLYSFILLPFIRIFYEGDSFYDLHNNEYCKAITIEFGFLFFNIDITFYFDFYKWEDK